MTRAPVPAADAPAPSLAVGGPVPPGAVTLDHPSGFIIPPDAPAPSLPVKVLRAVEWRGSILGEPACPLCSSLRRDGHCSDCELAALIGAPTREAP